MTITFADIDHAEQAIRTVKATLRDMAHEIASMRDGKPLGKQWGFNHYTRRNYTGTYSDEQEGGATYPDGTPVVIVTLHWSYNGGGDYMYVMFPQSYLGQDWRPIEQARIDAQRRDEEEQERIEEMKRAGEIEAAERATFERLKAKFEDGEAALTATKDASNGQ
ncbi:hypothetical protein RWE87_13525 [Sinorhizobium meliloti]|uniref:hypothetical protein n=1 Tax=Rhizobium meliloti TaxID=382 RepID=UPI00299D4DF9|nr:hypothetical protein [Sinorhizobium meliloti]